jgi:hypothetical protein
MQRSNILGIAALTAGLALASGDAGAQQKPIKEQLVGTWTLLLDDGIKEDGTQVPGYGPNPEGSLIFTADGHYALQIFRNSRPPFVSKDPLSGTADENKAAVQGMIAHFGTYAVDEAGKTITFRIAASSFPNWDATAQRRVVTAITDEVLTYNNPLSSSSGLVRRELAWKKAK